MTIRKYNSYLQESNNNREYDKSLNIDSIKTIIVNEWFPDFDIENVENKNKTHFEKISNQLVELGKISGKCDLAKKITALREILDDSDNKKDTKPKYSLDEIGTAIPEFIKESNKCPEELVLLHKQTISRIIDKEKKKNK